MVVKVTKPEYLHWSQAGGPNECEHGYAEGIPCPNCDANPRVQELRAENERLRAARIACEQQFQEKVARITLLEALIDTHNDECRECPVIES